MSNWLKNQLTEIKDPKRMNTQKGLALIAIILIVVGILIADGGIYWYFFQNKPIACTQEAKQCPDGSYVSRTGPNCEFAACPNSSNCAKEGERVRASGEGFPANCCSNLKPMYGYTQEDCSAPGLPGDIGTCSNCGNGVCESQNNENKCNCPEDCNKADKESCEKLGGKWGRFGADAPPAGECNLPTKDAGKVCSGSSECEGDCIAELSQSDWNKATNGIVYTKGKCTAWKITVGCQAFVENGKVQGILCKD